MGDVQSAVPQQESPALARRELPGHLHRAPSGVQAGQPVNSKRKDGGVPAGAAWWQFGSDNREPQSSPIQTPRTVQTPRQEWPMSIFQPSAGAQLPVKSLSLEDIEMDRSVKPLGKGSFGTVYKARLRGNHQRVAVKELDKAKLRHMKISTDTVKQEVEFMRDCSDANCNMRDRFVQIVDLLETKSKYFLILEFCDNGNLQDAAMSREAGFGEEHVRLLMKQMLESIVILYSKDICHRDIKPHNYLVCGNIDSHSVKIKLSDFGLAVRLPKGKMLRDQTGTPAFMAPEMHLLPNKSSGYDHKVDVWAIGVCMVFLLASEYPFIDGSGRLLRDKIIQGNTPLWEANAFQNLFNGFQEAVGIRRKKPSTIAVNLTRRLLAPRPQDRPHASKAMMHDWFHKPIVNDAAAGENLPLLDRRDFQAGFQAAYGMMDAIGKEAGLHAAMDAIGKLEIGINEHMPYMDPSDARLRSCAAYNGPSARGASWSTAASFGDVAQPQSRIQSRTLSGSSEDLVQYRARTLSGSSEDFPQHRARTLSGSFGDAPQHRARTLSGSSEDPQPRIVSRQVRTMSDSFAEVQRFGTPPSLGQRRSRTLSDSFSEAGHFITPQKEAMMPGHRSDCCLLCKSPSSMLDHVCPVCNLSVCAGCIRKHLAKDPRCPHCHDRDHNAQNMQMMLNAHSLWDKVTGTIANL